MTTTTYDDPMTAAMNATKQQGDRAYFGEVITVDSWFCVLEKGVGKRPWDATRDDVKSRRIVIKLEIQPLRGQYTIAQETLSFENTWIDFTMPSLQKCNADLHALRGKFAQVKRVPTGEQYKNKAGELKDRTALEFVAIYNTLQECQDAADAFFGEKASAHAAYAGMPDASLPADLGGMSPEQQFALSALPALWKASGNDKEKFAELIAENPLISRFYPVDHAVVQNMINGTVADLFPEHDPNAPF